MAQAPRDSNMIPVILATSNADGTTPLVVYVDSATNRLLVDANVTITAQFTDDAAFTPASSKVLAIGAMADDTAPDSVDEGDIGIIRMSLRRELYTQIRDAAGNERGVNVNASNQLAIAGPVTNAGTFVVQVDGAALTSLQLIDDVIVADDAAFTPATTKVAMAGFEYDDTAPDSVDEGDAGAARMSARREIYTQIRDAAGNERGANVNASNQLAVTGPVTNAGTFAVQVDGAALTSLQLIDDTIFVDDAAFTPATSKVLAIGFEVDDTSPDSVDEGDIGAPRMSASRIIYVQGQLAHDAVDAGNPLKIGAKAQSAEITAVANGDLANLITDLVGKLIVLPYANPENFVSGVITTAMTVTTSTSLIAAPAAGLRNYITQITVSNAHATVGTDMIIQDGSAGTILYNIPAAAVYGGAALSFPTPLRQPTTATAIFIQNVTTGASTKASASGYKGA